MDQQQLQLQNLLYQKKHLVEEIHKCEQFRSRHEDLAMEAEAAMLAQLPPAEAAALAQDPHKCMLARIDWELQQRTACGRAPARRGKRRAARAH